MNVFIFILRYCTRTASDKVALLVATDRLNRPQTTEVLVRSFSVAWRRGKPCAPDVKPVSPVEHQEHHDSEEIGRHCKG